MQDDDSLKKGIIDFKDALIQGTVANRDTASLTMWLKKTSWVNESLCQVSTEKKRTDLMEEVEEGRCKMFEG